MPDYDSKAQEHLSLAVKSDPTLIEAWNELGKFNFSCLIVLKMF